MNRVKVNAKYVYDPNLLDQIHKCNNARKGDLVRVINLPSAPRANTMGQCYIETVPGREFLGMCSVKSLVKQGDYHE